MSRDPLMEKFPDFVKYMEKGNRELICEWLASIIDIRTQLVLKPGTAIEDTERVRGEIISLRLIKSAFNLEHEKESRKNS